jgi:leucyl-tRNA synthetase
MMSDYCPKQVEQEAQAIWKQTKRFRVKESLDLPPYYVLAMLPYPSGQLHMGHVRNYVLADIVARYKRLQGHHVLHPIGWDAFGLPADNAAKKHGIPPEQWTKKNIATMRSQLEQLGYSYDWSKEINTSQPDYYKWNQWLMLQCYHLGLAYRKKSTVNWDPVDKTVLANEQVIQGRGWRSGALVEKKEIEQWFLKTTEFAESLDQGLDQLEHWPKQVTQMQRHWIGKKIGTQITFQVVDQSDPMTVFTTRADTIMGCTYLAISLEHPLTITASEQNNELKSFIAQQQHQSVAEAAKMDQEKVGFPTPYHAIHPISGKTIPIWVSNYVLGDYGDGAVMGVPAHDQRDYEFAQKYQLPIQQVVFPANPTTKDQSLPFTATGVLKNSDFITGQSSDQATKTIHQWLAKNKQGKPITAYRLRDWGISRQRFWGTPIPMIHCQACGIVPVPEDQLPVVLPTHIPLAKRVDGLEHCEDFLKTTCPKCKKPALRDSDTMDTFVDSSWYYLRYTCPDQHQSMVDDRAKYWSPVNHYIGGIEHATMHLLYARFIFKVLGKLNLVNADEPFIKLTTQGMVLNNGHKMSKSKGNTVKPEAMIDKYGADALRLFIIFQAPPEQSIEWNEHGIEGAHRFLSNIWKLAHHLQSITVDQQRSDINVASLRHQIHVHLKQINQDMERQQWNTTVSGAMKMFNVIWPLKKAVQISPAGHQILQEGMSILLRALSPIAPHLCFTLWQKAFPEKDLNDAGWPEVDHQAIQNDTYTLVIQVNSKTRDTCSIEKNMPEPQLKELVFKQPKIIKLIDRSQVKRVIIVPNKLINIVL